MWVGIIGKNIDEVLTLIHEVGGREEHAHELLKNIYKRGVFTFNEATQIPSTIREKLNDTFNIDIYPPVCKNLSTDGTIKNLFENKNGQQFESVYMPSPKRNTLCISTQSGCRMGCRFCLTGKIDFKGNLSASDILNQYLSIPFRKKVNRIVLMGMGEPFDNFAEIKRAVEILTADWGVAFGASNITLSSVGLHKPLKEFLEKPFCNLAISLNNPFSDERNLLMPIESSNPIVETVELIKANPLKKPLRISFEYVALSGLNVSEKHALGIAQLLKGIKYHLNIIPWNAHGFSPFNSPTELELNAFIDCLNSHGVQTTVRISRGQEIGAACGQMAGGKTIDL
jgi:23S rRNA (adenine2503-C2)-methyltransferase